jgi:hypothetical protein
MMGPVRARKPASTRGFPASGDIEGHGEVDLPIFTDGLSGETEEFVKFILLDLGVLLIELSKTKIARKRYRNCL